MTDPEQTFVRSYVCHGIFIAIAILLIIVKSLGIILLLKASIPKRRIPPGSPPHLDSALQL